MNYYHLSILVHRQATRYGRKTALKYRNPYEKKWKSISWKKFSENVMKTAWAMAEIGVEEGDKIAVYSQNMPPYLFTDFASYANRCVSVPIYATSSPTQVEYIVNDANVKLLFAGEQFQYNNAFKVQQNSSVLKRIIVFDKNVKLHAEDKTSLYFEDFMASGENSNAEVAVRVRMKSRQDDDIACIIYTSGTTGEPKGVVIPHSCFLQVFKIHDIRLTMTSNKDVSMNFLPLAHIFERAWTCYAIHKGMTIAINQDAKEIQKSIKQVKPTIMCSVPRFWEKVYAGVDEKISESTGIMKWLYTHSIKTGKKYNLDYKNKGIRAPFGTRVKFFLYNNTVFRILKMVIGIEKGNIFPCAGAPLSDSIIEFLHSVNIPIVIGYGLTETTATVSFYPEKGYVIESIGTLMPEVDVKIDSQNNEILVKGKTVMREYYNKPEETAKSFTEDGYFRTGDAGRLEGNVLYITERIKDLFKTANGKYIAPQAIETKVGEDKFIDMIAVIADERKFVSALIVPDYKALEEYAISQNISYNEIEDLFSNVDILRMLDGRIELLQATFAPYEKIKKYRLLSEPFTMEGGELTNTLKIKRKFVAEKYKNLIDKMYQE
ncbi:long-chain fatty acid--CoA ligase [Dysgonomonas sp. Marseille-P4677]|uniref:AMP-dependent synthetase/ligase n=1 Tax=Dysgonomonas sp. Marseille-P4677 TaxID=2364790 RepID=UPI0019149E83|nr:long-chain fatty acid--CoA ligase [Dysgonomonas sp. Marseille-P4677]MBK5720165.1 long-chain fatty acid--CoA ligase [Dysgonomonas sp. Marseille-P4677]